jgi:hypothetical protein
MELFFFGSKTLTNVWAGVGAGLWAVSDSTPQDVRSRITKSKGMRVGSLGIIYCGEIHSFTTPFLVLSEPDPDRVVLDVWPERWHLPFRIYPLGTPDKRLSQEAAKSLIPILKQSSTSSVTAALNITGTTVFVPKVVTAEDWEVFVRHLV